MSKAIKSLLVVCCFALASVSVQALACGEHADKASESSETETAEATCACGQKKDDKHENCDKHKEHHGEKSDHHKKKKS